MGVEESVWDDLAIRHGRRCVMSPTITDEQLDAETARQVEVIFPLIKRNMTGLERTALDYGCGSGRFTMPLKNVMLAPVEVVGYDPSSELLSHAPKQDKRIIWRCATPDRFFTWHPEHFDIVFTAMVLCLPHVDLEETATGMASVLAPGGMMCIVDHMADQQPAGKWVKFRPMEFYVNLFGRLGIELREIGVDKQLGNPITVLAGRKI